VIRVLIADDHSMVRMGLREMLSLSPEVSVVAEACDGREAVALYREHRPDVALLDLRMPGASGFEAIEAIRQEFPSARLIALSNYEGDEDIYRAIRAGAKAYVFKSVGGPDLLDTILSVHQGRQWLSPAVAERLASRVAAPTLKTVKVHVKRVLEKMGAASRSQAISTAIQKGVVHLD
jgi:two-component system, NarL family, response regulator